MKMVPCILDILQQTETNEPGIEPFRPLAGSHSWKTVQAGQDNVIKRPREHSLFGVAEKRAPAPFR